MANGDDTESRPRNVTQRDIWEELQSIRTETREARHSQNNLFQNAISSATREIRTDLVAESKETRDLVTAVELRVRALETATPSSLGSRLGDTEKWQAVMQSANLPNRVDHIESTLDQMRGSLNLLKYLQILVSLALGAITLIGFVIVNQRPV